jgi:ATP-binding cassette subfamily B protein
MSAAAAPPGTRRQIAGLAPSAGGGMLAGLLTLNVLLGIAPVVFLVEISLMLGRIAAVLGTGGTAGHWRGVYTAFAGAAAAFVVQQVLAPLQTSLGELAARRVDQRIAGRLMAAAGGAAGLAPLEDPGLLGELAEASRELQSAFETPGTAVAGLIALTARYLQLAGFALVVGLAFSWYAALGLVAAVLAFRYAQRGGLRKYAEIQRTITPVRRESDYLGRTILSRETAKELRVFGLAGWLSGRHREAYRAWLAPMWAERRRIYLRDYLWIAAVGGAIAVGVLAATGAAAGTTLSFTRLALVAQAVLAGLRLGDFYPESDTQTQFGIGAYSSVLEFERSLARFEGFEGNHGTARIRSVVSVVERSAPIAQTAVSAPSHGIRFEDVGFDYRGGRAALSGLELTIPAGQCTAIVGENGAGKTTIVKLLSGLYTPTRGRITVDGADLRGLSVEDWRRQLAVIFQDFTRYGVSAAANIGFGAVEHAADREAVLRAARKAGVAAVLDRLPRGMDTLLAPDQAGGVDLSGGQWQRIALARALFALESGASVLVLDEPTASLDVRAEARFYREFLEATRGVTTVLVSHRFGTVRHADSIVVVEHGRLLEQGDHDELLERGGRYAELFHRQAAGFAAAGRPSEIGAL